MSKAMLPLVMMVLSSSALSAFLTMGDEEEDSGGSDDSVGDEEEDSDDSAGDEDGGGGGKEKPDTPVVEYQWTLRRFQKFDGGEPIETIRNTSVSNCRNKCEERNKCVGFSTSPSSSSSLRCVLFSGDRSLAPNITFNTHILRRE